MKIVIIGLPGSGKSTLSVGLNKIAKLDADSVVMDADIVRASFSADLGFSIWDRVEHARRMSSAAKLLDDLGINVIMNLVCPTAETRQHFNDCVVIWLDTIKESRFADTNALFQPAHDADIVINEFLPDSELPALYRRICQKWEMKTKGNQHVDRG